MMVDTPIHYEHHGYEVWSMPHMAGKHKEHCMCHRCSKFHPFDLDNCPIAQALFEFDVKHGVTTPVFECKEFDMDQ